MNDDELLHKATRALRDEADASQARPDQTRARLMRTLTARRNRRLTAIRVLVPLAAVLIGSVAWAAATHRLPSAWYEMASKLGLGETEQQTPEINEAPARRAPPSKGPIARAPEADEEESAPTMQPASDEDPATTETPPAAAEEQAAITPKLRAATSVRTPSSAAAPVASAPAAPASAPAPLASASATAPEPVAAPAETSASTDPDTDALYRAAHQAHFVARNPSAALGAWDAYLAAAPRGRFAVEARYNRALCLVRLGRMAEARRTLEAFANGAPGSYRQAEARALLDAMNAAP